MCHLFLTIIGQIGQHHISLHSTAHHLEQGHLAKERVSNGLEYEQRRITLNVDLDLVAVCQLFYLLSGMSGEGIHDCVHNRNNAPQSGSGATEYGRDGTVNNTLVHSLKGFFLGELFTVEELHHHLIRGTRQSFLKNLLVSFSVCLKLGGHSSFGSLTAVVVNVCLHIDQVDHRNILTVLTNGNEYGAQRVTELIVQFCKGLIKVCIQVVALVDKECLRDAHCASLIPSKLGTNLKTCLTVNHNQRSVCYANCLVHFAFKIEVAGSVDHIDLNIFPENVCERCGQREASCLFLCVKVAYGVAIGGLAHTVNAAGYVQHRLCKRGLARAAVTHQRNVSDLLGVKSSHGSVPLFPFPRPFAGTRDPFHLNLLQNEIVFHMQICAKKCTTYYFIIQYRMKFFKRFN